MRDGVGGAVQEPRECRVFSSVRGRVQATTMRQVPDPPFVDASVMMRNPPVAVVAGLEAVRGADVRRSTHPPTLRARWIIDVQPQTDVRRAGRSTESASAR